MRKISGDKGAQQMTLGTIIAIVLGIAVLVFLIFGFSSGWNNLWERITAFGGGDANLDTVQQACALACSTQAKSGFCDQERTVNFGKEVGVTESCESSAAPIAGDATRDSCSATCEALSTSNVPEIGKVRVKECPGLC